MNINSVLQNLRFVSAMFDVDFDKEKLCAILLEFDQMRRQKRAEDKIGGRKRRFLEMTGNGGGHSQGHQPTTTTLHIDLQCFSDEGNHIQLEFTSGLCHILA